MKILRKIDVGIELSPEEIADCFCDLHDNEQALFFNHIADVVAAWGSSFCFQIQTVINSPALTTAGKATMRTIGEYDQED